MKNITKMTKMIKMTKMAKSDQNGWILVILGKVEKDTKTMQKSTFWGFQNPENPVFGPLFDGSLTVRPKWSKPI